MRLPAVTITINQLDVTVEQAAFEFAYAQLGDRHQAQKAINGGYVRKIFESNRGLAAFGMILPPGTRIDLPEFSLSNQRPTQRLWGQA